MTDDEEFDICRNEYGAYAVPRDFAMRVVPKVLAQGKVYEPRTLAFLRTQAGRGDIVSGGAFVGDFFPAIVGGLRPGARLISFEPNPISYRACLKTMALNDLDRVELHQVAVGAEPGKMALRIHDFRKDEPAAAQARVTPHKRVEEEGFIEIEVATIDSLVGNDREVAVIHLDVEGFEAEALKGAGETIARCRPVIVLEGEKVGADWLNAEFKGEGAYRHADKMEVNHIYVCDR